ncbi:MAG: hypothetical protein RMH84_03710 [Sulfolobales archaeon]|nr:hypothetical protein [Sulfolobales archaeon]MCX8209245.1 hypothetical protein [Sulfolobales archaeon]MDW8010680.1 hypothetical protein [Sulfolobales archaeon]
MLVLGLALLALTAVLLRELLIRARPPKAVEEVRIMLRTLDSGISLPRYVEGELGRVFIVTQRAGGWSTVVEFSAESKLILKDVLYRDLCSTTYLLALDERRLGYLEAPAIRVTSEPYRDTFIMCLNPQSVPRISKKVSVFEDTSSVEGVIELLDGFYRARAVWLPHELPSWRLIYDSRRRTFRIVKESRDGAVVGEVQVDVCVRPPTRLRTEVCATVVRSSRLGSEVRGSLDGLRELKLLITHRDNANLFKISGELGVSRYPHVSGYSEGCVSARVVLQTSTTQRISGEELL